MKPSNGGADAETVVSLDAQWTAEEVCMRVTLLLVTKDEINPFMEVGRHVVTLERFTVNANKLACVTLGPRRKADVV